MTILKNVLIALSLTAAAFAQGSGTIQGTITDSSDAIIPGATVIARNVNTGVETTRQTTAAGLYVLAPLPPTCARLDSACFSKNGGVSLSGFFNRLGRRSGGDLLAGRQQKIHANGSELGAWLHPRRSRQDSRVAHRKLFRRSSGQVPIFLELNRQWPTTRRT